MHGVHAWLTHVLMEFVLYFGNQHCFVVCIVCTWHWACSAIKKHAPLRRNDDIGSIETHRPIHVSVFNNKLVHIWRLMWGGVLYGLLAHTNDPINTLAFSTKHILFLRRVQWNALIDKLMMWFSLSASCCKVFVIYPNSIGKCCKSIVTSIEQVDNL